MSQVEELKCRIGRYGQSGIKGKERKEQGMKQGRKIGWCLGEGGGGKGVKSDATPFHFPDKDPNENPVICIQVRQDTRVSFCYLLPPMCPHVTT